MTDENSAAPAAAAPEKAAAPTIQEADAALIAFIHRTLPPQKAARIEAIIREPDL